MEKQMKVAWLDESAKQRMRAMIANAKARGRKMEVPPHWGEAVREAGLWDDAVHYEARKADGDS